MHWTLCLRIGFPSALGKPSRSSPPPTYTQTGRGQISTCDEVTHLLYSEVSFPPGRKKPLIDFTSSLVFPMTHSLPN